MDDYENLDPPMDYSAESNWIFTADSDDVYFRESNILRESGWNPNLNICRAGLGDFDPIASEFIQSAVVFLPESTVTSPVEKSILNQSVTSSSSEDPAEKSIASGAGQKQPSESVGRDKDKKKGAVGKGKRVRQQRVAFMTKSEIDQLEDGFRWRKYGQKAVKNSPFPRSYYRCTNSKCTVKKRVERSFEDPSIVITTYEGQHCHHSAGSFPISAGVINNESAGAAVAAYRNHYTNMPPQSAAGTLRSIQPRLLVPSPPSTYNNNIIGIHPPANT